MPCFFQCISDHIWLFNHDSIFSHRFYRFYYIVLLITHSANHSSSILKCKTCSSIISNLSTYYEHRNRIKPASYNSGQSICSSGSCCNTKCSNLIIKSRISFGCYRTRLLMVIVCNMKAFIMSKRIIEVHCTTAYYTEYIYYSMFYKKVCYIICKPYLHS